MKKLKNEKELVKKAITLGVDYAEKRGVVEFEPTDSASESWSTSIGCWYTTR